MQAGLLKYQSPSPAIQLKAERNKSSNSVHLHNPAVFTLNQRRKQAKGVQKSDSLERSLYHHVFERKYQ